MSKPRPVVRHRPADGSPALPREGGRDMWMRRHLVALCRAALLGVVLLLVVEAYFPFAWDPPRIVHNDVTRSADGILRFGEMNSARTPGTPAWLSAVRASGHV